MVDGLVGRLRRLPSGLPHLVDLAKPERCGKTSYARSLHTNHCNAFQHMLGWICGSCIRGELIRKVATKLPDFVFSAAALRRDFEAGWAALLRTCLKALCAGAPGVCTPDYAMRDLADIG